jgi:hypothetical protein
MIPGPVLAMNIAAPVIAIGLTALLLRGAKESATVNK